MKPLQRRERRDKIGRMLTPRYASVVLALCLVVGMGLMSGLAGGQAQRRSLSAATWKGDSTAVHRVLAEFLEAFENLDEPAFLAAFSESATIFHPAPSMASRVAGRAAIDSTFHRVFAEIRANAREGPPFHRLPAEDLSIRPLAAGVVMATFHLKNPERLGRRTVVLRREGTRWRIVHLHASNFSLPPSASATAQSQPASRLEKLSWMTGSWSWDSAGSRNEEHWMAPSGGLMVGMNRTVRAGRARAFEFLRIRETGDTIAYLAMPGARSPATEFRLTELGERRVVFENHDHDFPQRIAYWLGENGRLFARVDGKMNGREVAEHYVWKRAAASGG